MISKKIIIDGDELYDILLKTLTNKFAKDNNIIFGDEKYYCPSYRDIRALLKKNYIDKMKYTEEKYDCDDFAISLKYFFIKDSYANKIRRYPHCFGILMGGELKEGSHAINIVITNKKKVYFIEPQNDKMFKLRKEDKDIYFIYF